MHFEALEIPDVKLIRPKRHGDDRGYFAETFKDTWFRENIADVGFVQDNESLSAKQGTLRGLHFQSPPFEQGKLVRCNQGAFLDVAVDIRQGSPTFGKWVASELSATNGAQLWVPAGFAHGFVTLEPDTMVIYKVTAPYSAEHDRGIRWDDPEIGIVWPDMPDFLLSPKDREQPRLGEMQTCFTYG